MIRFNRGALPVEPALNVLDTAASRIKILDPFSREFYLWTKGRPQFLLPQQNGIGQVPDFDARRRCGDVIFGVGLYSLSAKCCNRQGSGCLRQDGGIREFRLLEVRLHFRTVLVEPALGSECASALLVQNLNAPLLELETRGGGPPEPACASASRRGACNHATSRTDRY